MGSAVSGGTWLAIGYFVLATLLLVHPLYSQLGNFVEPRVLGMPFSLVYVLIIIAANTLVLTWLYRARVIDPGEDEDPRG